jgi:uncharacterized protein YgiM (DUF1202 family)
MAVPSENEDFIFTFRTLRDYRRTNRIDTSVLEKPVSSSVQITSEPAHNAATAAQDVAENTLPVPKDKARNTAEGDALGQVSVLPLDKVMSATSNVKVRATPSASGIILDGFQAGEKVKVTGKVNGINWFRIERGGGRGGYVSGDYLE